MVIERPSSDDVKPTLVHEKRIHQVAKVFRFEYVEGGKKTTYYEFHSMVKLSIQLGMSFAALPVGATMIDENNEINTDNKINKLVHPYDIVVVAKIDGGVDDEYHFTYRLATKKPDEAYTAKLKASFDRIVAAEMGGKSTKWVDPDFPPVGESIVEGDGEDSPLAETIKDVTWARPENFVHKSSGIIEVFKDGIHPMDVVQGDLGNCWLVGTFAALSEYPKDIEDIFITEHNDGSGKYGMKLCINGEWQTVWIDDYLPIHATGSRPVFSSCNGGELWTALLEKVFAKVYGSYSALDGGYPIYAMMDLTGCPAEDYMVEDILEAKDAFWERLCLWSVNDEDYTITCSAAGEEEIEDPVTGLISGHLYTLLEAKGWDKKGVKLVKFRNPWGSVEWKGNWSDDDEKWTPEALAYFNHTIARDGTFWMPYDIALEHMGSIQVAFCKPWFEIRKKNSFSGIKTPLYKLTHKGEGTVEWITMMQPDQRMKGSPEHVDMGLLVLKMEKDGSMRAVAALNHNKERATQGNVNLSRGTYLLVPMTSGIIRENADYTMVIHASNTSTERTTLEEMPWSEATYNRCVDQTVRDLGYKEPVRDMSLHILELDTMGLIAIQGSRKAKRVRFYQGRGNNTVNMAGDELKAAGTSTVAVGKREFKTIARFVVDNDEEEFTMFKGRLKILSA